MSVLLIAGSPSERSRTAALLEATGQRLEARGVQVDRLRVRDLSPQALLPLATGGSPHHMLALDYSLRPVLQSLGAKHILPGIYATDAQVTVSESGSYQVGTDIGRRLDDAVHTLVTETLQPGLAIAARFAPVAFSQLQYSS